jgi:hypothetical protein
VQVPMTKLELRSVLEPYGEPTVTEMSTPYRGYVFVDLRTTEARAVQVKNGHEIILEQKDIVKAVVRIRIRIRIRICRIHMF